MDKILDDTLKIYKEPKKVIISFIIACVLTFVILCIVGLSTTKTLLLFSAIFLFSYLILYRKKKATSPDPKEVQKRFESDEMTQCKIKFTCWLRENSPDEYEKQINLPIEKRDKFFKGIDEARRFISNCFWNIWECYRDGLLNKEDIKGFVYSAGIDLIINKIEPLEAQISKVIGRDYDKAAFNFFRKLYKI